MNHIPIRSAKRFLIFGSPAIEEPEIQEVTSVLKSGWLGTGPKVAEFEKEFKAYKGANHAIAVNSCTAALHLSLIASEVGPGDEVITTAMTFCATVNAIIHSGATPVLVDIDPETLNIDPAQVESHITDKTRAIVLVHYGGRPCAMDVLCDIAKRHNLKIIEDCAHAIETEHKGHKVGTFGDFSCFSFYVTKNIVTGEGGMILARKEEDASRIKNLALHGMSKDAWSRFSDKGYKHYHVVECGYKSNMMDMQAAIGLHQLKRVDSYWQRRKQIWQRYHQALRDAPVKLPAEPEANTKHAYHLFAIQINKAEAGITRDEFLDAMTGENIGVGVHYLSIPEHPYYQSHYGWKTKDYPNAMCYGHQTVSLPLSAKLSDGDVDDVVKAVFSILNRASTSKNEQLPCQLR